MSPRPKHRAAPRRRMPLGASGRVLVAALAVALAAVVGPAAYADRGSSFSSNGNNSGNNNGNNGDNNTQKPPQPKPKPEPKPDQPEDSHSEVSDVHVPMPVLRPTAQPVTAYEMPFPCGEAWTGTTRGNHSPSVRSVDFNRPDDLGSPVVAAADGVVTTAVTGRKKPGYGQHVVVDHGNDESTMYAHLDSVEAKVGQLVARGTLLGTVGNTGNSHGAHLHFEQRKGRSVVDPWFHASRFPMNSTATSQNCATAADVPLAGNVIGSKPAELLLFRRAATATFHIKRPGRDDKVINFGAGTDQPMLGDWDGNGQVNPGVRTPKTKTFQLRVRNQVTEVKFGRRDDIPIAGNWDGVGAWEIGLRRAGTNQFWLHSASGEVSKVALGDADDLPVTGDWDGDGRTDLGVYDQATSTFTLWRVDFSGLALTSDVVFGAPGDLPVTGDWDGDGLTDLGVWNPATATFSQRIGDSPAGPRSSVKRVAYGQGFSNA